jgi:hypothetical protein
VIIGWDYSIRLEIGNWNVDFVFGAELRSQIKKHIGAKAR